MTKEQPASNQIVQWLRERESNSIHGTQLRAAADEIERLERENAALREAGEHKLDRLLAEIESVLPRPSAETSCVHDFAYYPYKAYVCEKCGALSLDGVTQEKTAARHCQHDLLLPDSTVMVDADSHGGRCVVCHESWSFRLAEKTPARPGPTALDDITPQHWPEDEL